MNALLKSITKLFKSKTYENTSQKKKGRKKGDYQGTPSEYERERNGYSVGPCDADGYPKSVRCVYPDEVTERQEKDKVMRQILGLNEKATLIRVREQLGVGVGVMWYGMYATFISNDKSDRLQPPSKEFLKSIIGLFSKKDLSELKE